MKNLLIGLIVDLKKKKVVHDSFQGSYDSEYEENYEDEELEEYDGSYASSSEYEEQSIDKTNNSY